MYISGMRIQFLLPFISVLFLIFASGCSSSGSSDKDDGAGGFANVTLNGISGSEELYYEGDQVVLSLDITMDKQTALTYDWTVKLNNQPVAFTGDNTKTIKFVAPDVAQRRSMSIAVDIDLKNGTLMGQTNHSFNIYIENLDIETEVDRIGDAFATEMPEVSALDFSGISASVWRAQDRWIALGDALGIGIEAYQQYNSDLTVFLDTVEGVLSYGVCGTDSDSFSPVAELLVPANDDLECAGNLTSKYYQQDQAFRVEYYCDGVIQEAIDFTYLAEQEDFTAGEIFASFDSYEDFSADSQVCYSRFDISHTIALENTSGRLVPTEISSSSLLISAPYADGYLGFVFTLDNIPSSILDFYSISATDTTNYNDVTIISDVLTELDGALAVSGYIDLKQSPLTIESDMSLSGEMGVENVAVSITLDERY